MFRAFCIFTGYQKSIRVRETKISMVHQYFRPHQQSIQFYSETDWKLCPVCGFGAEPVPFSKTKASSRCRLQTLPLPLAATQPSSPHTKPPLRPQRAVAVEQQGFHVVHLLLPHLTWQRALHAWQDGGSGRFQPLSETVG